MNASEVIAKYEKRQPQIASEWLAPLDARIAALIDKADRMSPGAFLLELEREMEAIPGLFNSLNADALQDELENAIGESIIAALS
jgi:hypothetical protein